VFHPVGVWRAETFSRFVRQNPEKVAFVWHTKREKPGIRLAKREKLGFLPHQTTKPRIPATPNEKSSEFCHTKRENPGFPPYQTHFGFPNTIS
jgi:hypothetical protein